MPPKPKEKKKEKKKDKKVKKMPSDLDIPERVSNLQHERQNLSMQLRKDQAEAFSMLSKVREEEKMIRKVKDEIAEQKEQHKDVYAVMTRIHLHEEISFKIHMTSILNDRERLQAKLKAAERSLKEIEKQNRELEKAINLDIQNGDSRIQMIHFRYPQLFETLMKKFRDEFVNNELFNWAQDSATSLHQDLKNALVMKTRLKSTFEY